MNPRTQSTPTGFTLKCRIQRLASWFYEGSKAHHVIATYEPHSIESFRVYICVETSKIIISLLKMLIQLFQKKCELSFLRLRMNKKTF